MNPTPFVSRFLVVVGGFCLAGAAPCAADDSAPDATVPAGENAAPVPFKEVIKNATQHRVLDFDTNNPAHLELQNQLVKAAALAGKRAASQGLPRRRTGEARSEIKNLVQAALREAGLQIQRLSTAANAGESPEYPDFEIAGSVPCYLEVKTYNAGTAHGSQHTFHYSPSRPPRITRDALHFILAFQVERERRDGETALVPIRWKLVTLEDLSVTPRREFNQCNRELYHGSLKVLGEDVVE